MERKGAIARYVTHVEKLTETSFTGNSSRIFKMILLVGNIWLIKNGKKMKKARKNVKN